MRFRPLAQSNWVYILPAKQGWLLLRFSAEHGDMCIFQALVQGNRDGWTSSVSIIRVQGRPGNGTVCVHFWDGFLGGSGATKVHRIQHLNFDAHISTMKSRSSQLCKIEQCMTSEDIYDSWKHRPGSEGCSGTRPGLDILGEAFEDRLLSLTSLSYTPWMAWTWRPFFSFCFFVFFFSSFFL